ncbi:hypothetical protein LN042_18830 [Kitasatospora sp. RB6PN24]|uniref:hypothetical protein n=1 Tax=Kitasatospora humi TaxID=2893891 RepID=UPI001E424AA5|nr:hypothetical protein [Kitasatospora humi]MCC9309111.1 hypothetical protein [Kitasatospora humi]
MPFPADGAGGWQCQAGAANPGRRHTKETPTMMFALPADLPEEAQRVAQLRTYLAQLPNRAPVVADVDSPEDGGPRRIAIGWPVQATIRDHTGRRVPVIALPQEDGPEAAVDVALLRSHLAGLPDSALVVAIWETPDGPRQTTLGQPEAVTAPDEHSGAPRTVAALPQVLSAVTGYAYDEIVDNLGWE